jgi:hypothetical protein
MASSGPIYNQLPSDDLLLLCHKAEVNAFYCPVRGAPSGPFHSPQIQGRTPVMSIHCQYPKKPALVCNIPYTNARSIHVFKYQRGNAQRLVENNLQNLQSNFQNCA